VVQEFFIVVDLQTDLNPASIQKNCKTSGSRPRKQGWAAVFSRFPQFVDISKTPIFAILF